MHISRDECERVVSAV